VQPPEEPTDSEARLQPKLAAQLRAQLKECGRLSAPELAYEQRVAARIRPGETLTQARHDRPETSAKARRHVNEEIVSASTLSRKNKWKPRSAWAKEYERLNHYPYPPEFYAFKCRARTRAGTPCKLRPFHANGRCKFHGGPSTGPKTEQGRRQSALNGRKGGRPRKRVVRQEPKT
jgi:hypothetical protein